MKRARGQALSAGPHRPAERKCTRLSRRPREWAQGSVEVQQAGGGQRPYPLEAGHCLRVPLQGPKLASPRALPLTALPRPLPHSEKLAGTRLEVEDIALTAASQRRKLEMVLEAANRSLQVQEPQVKWSVDST